MQSFAMSAAFLVLSTAVAPVMAQGALDYPNKPIRLILAGSTGGSTDVINRLVTSKLTERWGQPFLIENITGASGAIASGMTAKALPNGYTLYGVASSTVVSAAVGQITSVNYRTAYAPITNMVSQPYVMVINAGLPVNSVKELIALAKKEPGKLNFASLGVGATTHLGMELFNMLAGTDIVHIPFKGTNQAGLAIVAGEVNVLLGGALSAMPLAKAGKIKALAVTSAQRSKLFPDLPTVAEAGLPGFDVDAWFGMAAPAGTPPAIVSKIHGEILRVLAIPEIRDKLMANGSEITPSDTPAAFGQHINRELDKWEKFVKTTGIKL